MIQIAVAFKIFSAAWRRKIFVVRNARLTLFVRPNMCQPAISRVAVVTQQSAA